MQLADPLVCTLPVKSYYFKYSKLSWISTIQIVNEKSLKETWKKTLWVNNSIGNNALFRRIKE